ncbi:hypothetical protein Rhopal_007842-T1 [Rhodotorula paludigena]|uniref:Proteophosphoglycan ppg4 n=1 Tax=Rhodotorula paludigena TaxID=86838 RepID=A0AAV5GXP7_9BASI|nr:hypothetical protein Rhopal_007842-T1 [Rhodotorula paludigena]
MAYALPPVTQSVSKPYKPPLLRASTVSPSSSTLLSVLASLRALAARVPARAPDSAPTLLERVFCEWLPRSDGWAALCDACCVALGEADEGRWRARISQDAVEGLCDALERAQGLQGHSEEHEEARDAVIRWAGRFVEHAEGRSRDKGKGKAALSGPAASDFARFDSPAPAAATSALAPLHGSTSLREATLSARQDATHAGAPANDPLARKASSSSRASKERTTSTSTDAIPAPDSDTGDASRAAPRSSTFQTASSSPPPVRDDLDEPKLVTGAARAEEGPVLDQVAREEMPDEHDEGNHLPHPNQRAQQLAQSDAADDGVDGQNDDDKTLVDDISDTDSVARAARRKAKGKARASPSPAASGFSSAVRFRSRSRSPTPSPDSTSERKLHLLPVPTPTSASSPAPEDRAEHGSARVEKADAARDEGARRKKVVRPAAQPTVKRGIAAAKRSASEKAGRGPGAAGKATRGLFARPSEDGIDELADDDEAPPQAVKGSMLRRRPQKKEQRAGEELAEEEEDELATSSDEAGAAAGRIAKKRTSAAVPKPALKKRKGAPALKKVAAAATKPTASRMSRAKTATTTSSSRNPPIGASAASSISSDSDDEPAMPASKKRSRGGASPSPAPPAKRVQPDRKALKTRSEIQARVTGTRRSTQQMKEERDGGKQKKDVKVKAAKAAKGKILAPAPAPKLNPLRPKPKGPRYSVRGATAEQEGLDEDAAGASRFKEGEVWYKVRQTDGAKAWPVVILRIDDDEVSFAPLPSTTQSSVKPATLSTSGALSVLSREAESVMLPPARKKALDDVNALAADKRRFGKWLEEVRAALEEEEGGDESE